MNVNTIVIAPEVAKAKLDEYSNQIKGKRLEEDDLLRSLYKSVLKGARVINILEAFRSTGLNELGQPKLAIARADAKEIFFRPRAWTPDGDRTVFTMDRWFEAYHVRKYVPLPPNTFINPRGDGLRSVVPHIPPAVRPTTKPENYHILFEVEKWEEYPVDPFLLRRISGYLYVVEAEWELTPLEASLLGSMRGGSQ